MKLPAFDKRKISLPIITIIAFAFTLITIVAISSYRSIYKEQQTIKLYLRREGITLLSIFEGRAIHSVSSSLTSGNQWKVYLQGLVNDITKKLDVTGEKEIEYLLITDENGRIIIQNQSEKISLPTNPALAVNGRIITLPAPEKGRIFEIAMSFNVLKSDIYKGISPSQIKSMNQDSIEDFLKSRWAMIGLDMRQFDEPRKKEIRNITLMGFAILAFGSLILYFMIILQNNYLRRYRYEHELEIATEIQKKLLPQKLPQNMGLQISARNIMAQYIGGDYYDFSVNKRGQLALVVADPMGHGVSSALLMTTIRAIWQSWVNTESDSPGKILDIVNQTAYSDLRSVGAFITMFSALYNPTTSIFQYSNAGHNPPIFYSASNQKMEELSIGGIPIGVKSSYEYQNGQLSLGDGDVIVIYTDGLVETLGNSDALSGYEKLCQIMNQSYNFSAEDIKNAVLSELNLPNKEIPFDDDITIVVLKKA
jgi:serine phosphatase RsbU (regulator of sigma subunit)